MSSNAIARCATWATIAVLSGCSAAPTAALPDSDAGAVLDGSILDSGSDAGVADSGVGDGGFDASGFANPLETISRDETWHFVHFPGAYCANGSTTGIGVNLTSASDDLLIFLAPGGGCWDQQTCDDSCAINLPSGYDETHGTPTWSTFGSNFASTIFDRTDAQNPLRTFNYAYVFYCTGDTHAGSRIATYTVKGLDGGPQPVHHLGYQNLLGYVKALKATFSPQKVALFGGSAGGFGVYTGYDAVARAFSAPVYMIDDSGPDLQNAYWAPDSGAAMAHAWGISAAIPAGCTDCWSNDPDGGLAALAPYLSATYPQGRMALVSSLEDGEIRQRYSLDGGAYAAALTNLATEVLAPLPNWRTFFLAGDTHTAIEGRTAQDTSCGLGVTTVSGLNCGQTLLQFITQEMSGSSSAWQSSTPPAGASGTLVTFPSHPYCALGQ